jgi:hypothetical protein
MGIPDGGRPKLRRNLSRSAFAYSGNMTFKPVFKGMSCVVFKEFLKLWDACVPSFVASMVGSSSRTTRSSLRKSDGSRDPCLNCGVYPPSRHWAAYAALAITAIAVVCSLPRASLLMGAGFRLLSRGFAGTYADANSVPSRSIACMMIARRRARATLALRIIDRWAIAKAQSLSLSWPLGGSA